MKSYEQSVQLTHANDYSVLTVVDGLIQSDLNDSLVVSLHNDGGYAFVIRDKEGHRISINLKKWQLDIVRNFLTEYLKQSES